jgi:hypothetical protein
MLVKVATKVDRPGCDVGDSLLYFSCCVVFLEGLLSHCILVFELFNNRVGTQGLLSNC